MMLFERAHFVATTPKPVSKKAAALGLKNSVAELSGKNAPEVKMEGGKLNQNELKYFENSMDLMQVNGKATKRFDVQNNGQVTEKQPWYAFAYSENNSEE